MGDVGSLRPIGSLAAPLFDRLLRSEGARFALIRTQWARLVGDPLAERLVPAALEGARLSVRLSDRGWEDAARSVLCEVARKLRSERPELGVCEVELDAGLEARPSRRPA